MEITPSHDASIRRMLGLMRTVENMQGNMQSIAAAVGGQIAAEDPTAGMMIQSVFSEIDYSGVLDVLVPLWASRVSEEQANAIADLFESDTYRTFERLMQEGEPETSAAIQAWMQGAVISKLGPMGTMLMGGGFGMPPGSGGGMDFGPH
jgi:hypothetical protein